MIRLLDTHYRTALAQYINEYFVDTDEEVKSIPQSAPGSYAISAESGTKFYANSAGQWPQDLSKYNAGGIGGGSTGGGVFTVTINGKTKDKTFEEINNAYKKGLTVKVRRATSDGMYQIMDLTICQEDSTYYFSGVMFTGSNVTILGVAIFDDDSFAPMDKTL